MAKSKTYDNGANLGFEEKLWQTADKLRNNMDAIERDNPTLKGVLSAMNYARPALKKNHKFRDRHKELTNEEIQKIASTYHAWRG